MGNPYSRTGWTKMAGIATDLYNIKERSRLTESEQGLKKSKQAQDYELGQEANKLSGLRTKEMARRTDVYERGVAVDEAKVHKAQKPIKPKNWYMMSAKISGGLKAISPRAAKTIEPIMGQMESLVQRGANPLQMKAHFSANWKTAQVAINEAIDKEMETTHNPAKLEQLAGLKEELSNPEFVNQLFPIATQYEEELKATREHEAGLRATSGTSAETWGPPGILPGGGKGQISSRGKINQYQAPENRQQIDARVRESEELIHVHQGKPAAQAHASYYNTNSPEPFIYVPGEAEIEVPGSLYGTNKETVDGFVKQPLETPDDVKAAYKQGIISYKRAERLLKMHFGAK